MYRIYRSNVQGIYSLCIGCYTPLNGWLYIHSLSVTNKKKNNIILIASIICLDSKLFGQKSPFKEIFLISLQRVKLINWLRSIFDCFESGSMGGTFRFFFSIILTKRDIHINKIARLLKVIGPSSIYIETIRFFISFPVLSSKLFLKVWIYLSSDQYQSI